MLVLIDLEWNEVIKNERYATQLSAIRVKDDWTISDYFTSIIAPTDKIENIDWQGIPYHGYTPEEFLSGETESECYYRFKSWLHEDDLLCCNGDQTEKTFHFLHNRYDENASYRSRCIYAKPILVKQSLIEDANKSSIYQLAENAGIIVPKTEHCSENDVRILYELFVKLNISVWQLYQSQKGKAKEIVPIRLRNKAAIELNQYQFVYTKDSDVYHNNRCRLILNAKNLCGCNTVKTASKNRRPCLRCKPEGYLDWKKSENDRLLKGKLDAEFPRKWKNLHQRDKVASVNLINGKKIFICWKQLIGSCSYKGHPGMLVLENIKEHNCFQKRCVCFSLNPLSDYWLNKKGKTKRDRKKEQLHLEKEMAAAMEEKEELLKAELQEKADHSESNLLIVRVTIVKKTVIRINFVSENSFADGNLFPDFLESINESYPNLKIIMRHVRDISGRFVTKDQFLKMKL